MGCDLFRPIRLLVTNKAIQFKIITFSVTQVPFSLDRTIGSHMYIHWQTFMKKKKTMQVILEQSFLSKSFFFYITIIYSTHQVC